MVKFNQLQVAKFKKPKRKGRGISAGSGNTAGRGTKGQKARSGFKSKPLFEGGQTPLIRKLPKLPGFKSHRIPAIVIYTGQLDDIKTNSKIIDNHCLAQLGLIDNPFLKVKLITKGEIKKAHYVQLQKASASAIASLQKAGGQFEIIPRPKRPASTKKTQKAEARSKNQVKKKS